ncbi:MAG: hypothetical protein P5680_23775 [Limnospira sp. PMC 737.11]|uniref:Uncharacterized protein n=1 Tax=Limnospira fusiformis PMC 851.14 TaxID=2219512 RepID=A0ABU9EQY6_LIMFS|nr:hypothetical protein [Limnospira sp. PMC 737.11]MDT9277557.1 hypothetical protein [Limnospira sp. PMC 737.11]
MENTNIKQEAKRLIDELPDNSTWDDLMYSIYVRQMVEAGIADSAIAAYKAIADKYKNALRELAK